MALQSYLLISGALFSIGIYGLLTRKSAIGLLVAVELMANAVNINLVALSRYLGHAEGQVFTLFTIALTVAEAVVGLALVLLLYRAHKSTEVSQASEMNG